MIVLEDDIPTNQLVHFVRLDQKPDFRFFFDGLVALS